MRIVEYPRVLDPEKEGVWERFVKKNWRKYGRFIALFAVICERLKEDDAAFSLYVQSGHIKRLDEDLWEFRIPPSGKGGVLRVYFCFSRLEEGKIVILDAEVKKRSKGNLDNARNRLRVYREWEKGVRA